MAKLEILYFDNYRFKKELANKSFYINTKYSRCDCLLQQ